MKMTHILNAAYSEKTSFLYVNTSQKFYKDRQFECNFLGLSAVDCPTYKMSKYFKEASDFIDLALTFPQGKNCYYIGKSYFVITKNWYPLQEKYWYTVDRESADQPLSLLFTWWWKREWRDGKRLH